MIEFSNVDRDYNLFLEFLYVRRLLLRLLHLQREVEVVVADHLQVVMEDPEVGAAIII